MTTAASDRDIKNLPPEQRHRFKEAVRAFHDAAVRATAGEADPWPRGLRVKRIEGTRGIWEMTWSFRNPDGRATWEWTIVGDDEIAVRWRRVGDHDIFGNP